MSILENLSLILVSYRLSLLPAIEADCPASVRTLAQIHARQLDDVCEQVRALENAAVPTAARLNGREFPEGVVPFQRRRRPVVPANGGDAA